MNATFVSSGIIIGIARNKENTLIHIHNKEKDTEYCLRVKENGIEVRLFDFLSWDNNYAYWTPVGKSNHQIQVPVKITRIENKILENELNPKEIKKP
jgi:hypothetical protein